ncbi:DUF6356 family protein [Rhodovibrionaceae bacterium A322]
MFKLFTDHPQSVGESYFEHMGMAFSFGSRMFVTSLACLLHGFFPFLFVKTGSNLINTLHGEMVTNRDRRLPQDRPQQDAPAHPAE